MPPQVDADAEPALQTNTGGPAFAGPPVSGICTVEVGTYIMPHLRVYSLYSS